MTTMRRKPVQLDHHHFGEDPSDPTFNIHAARKAHADVMRRWDDPVEGDDFKAMMLHTIQNMTALEIEKHRDEIQRFLDEFGTAQKNTLAKAIVKSYVETTFDAVRKADHHHRQWVETNWKRNHGRFSDFVGDIGAPSYEPMHTPIGFAQQERVDVAAHRQLLQQVAAISAAAGGKGQGVMYHIREKGGKVRQEMPNKGKLPRLKRGEELIGPRGTGIKGDNLTMGESTFNLIQALGATSKTAQRDVHTFQTGLDFHGKWHAHANANYGNETGAAYNRIGAGAQALQSIAGNSPKAQVAIAVGKWVGNHGAEAEKVIGPHARKSAYKYRGVERTPRNLPGNQDQMSKEAYHDRLVGRISGNIPSAGVHALNLASGYTAPSHGYLLDKNGRVLTEAHGYGDDHYLPFKLSGMTRMKDGSYIRTRATGGPTTEDIYAASVSGGRQFTVASRQGTYEVTFDKDFTQNKRFGDIAMGMSKRYGKILDAVKNGNVHAKGEVTDRQYQGWFEKGMKDNEGSPNQEQLAHRYARNLATAQESEKGRALKLDGEGYEYALRALKSQYPYYIDKTTWTAPQDKRFWDVDDHTGGHLARVGDVKDEDTGYVKARHIKSAHAMVGYFDKTIGGEAKDIHGGLSGKGKIQGDLAYYQNWKRNPYNRPRTAPVVVPGNGGDRKGQDEKKIKERQGALASGQLGINTRHQQGNQIRTPPGAGVHRVGSNLNAHEERLLKMARQVVKYREDNNQTPAADLAQWAKNPDMFREAMDAEPKKTESRIVEHHGRIDGLGTDTEIHQHGDEAVDTTMNAADQSKRRNEIESYLERPGVRRVRERLIEGATELINENPQKYQELDPHGSDWGFYHGIDRKTLLNHVWPNNAPGVTPANRAMYHGVADRLLREEKEMEKLENDQGFAVAQRWSPNRAEDMKDAPDENQKQPSPSEVKVPDEVKGDKEVGHHLAVADHLADMTSAIEQVGDVHRGDAPDADQDPAERAEWRTRGRHLADIREAFDNAIPDDGGDSLSDAHSILGFHLANSEFGDLGDIGVSLGNGEQTTLRDLYRHARENEFQRHEAKKNYVISKRNGRFVIRKAA